MIKDEGSIDRKIRETIEFQAARVFSTLARNYMCILEDLREIHGVNFDKLRDNLPLEYGAVIDLSDYLNNSFPYYRKKVLDVTSGARRDLESVLKDLYSILDENKENNN